MKKISVILLMMIFVLSGCATKKDTLKVGMECNYAPFNYTQVDGRNGAVAIDEVSYCNGYDVKIAKTLADKIGKELEIVKMSWNGLEPSLRSGSIDAIIAGMTANNERREHADFTTPYFDSDLVLIVRKGEELEKAQSIQEFSGKKVVGQLATNYDEIIDQIQGVIHVTGKETYPLMVVALQQKEVDAITAETPVAIGVVESNPDLTYVKFEKGKGFDIDTTVSVAVKKGNTELLNQLQIALDTIDADTRLKWMLEATKNQPANDELKLSENPILKTFEIAMRYSKLFVKGIQTTLFLSLSGTLIGLVIGLLLGVLRSFEIEESDSFMIKIFKKIAFIFVEIYVAIFRGTPMIVQAMFLFYGLKAILGWDNITAGIVIISINTGSYMVEIIRSGIQSISSGQKEAARSLGLTHTQSMFNVILPQAIKNAFPSIGNEFIVNIKDSAVLSVIGITDLYFQGNAVAGSLFVYTETFFVIAILYFILTFITSKILNYVEKRLNKTSTSFPKSVTIPERGERV